MPFAAHNWTDQAYDLIRTKWPYLNRSIIASQTRHFITHTCDQGPGSCNYANRDFMRIGGLPRWWNPADPHRVIGHLQWNGRRDGADAGMQDCLVCFQHGKDVQLVTGQNTCGPLCGYNQSQLRAWSMWSPEVTEEAKRAHAARKHVLFYGGRIHAARGDGDSSGRAQILNHVSRPGWHIVNTMGDDPEHPLPVEVRSSYKSFAEEMSSAEFCYSPLGQFEGDTDRYVASIMFGCIPVMLKTAIMGPNRVPMAQPCEERLDWSTFSVMVDVDDVPGRLPDILGNVTRAQRRRMRGVMARIWKRFLWSSIYGSYLGEERAGGDAFETLMDVFRTRVAAMPPLPTA